MTALTDCLKRHAASTPSKTALIDAYGNTLSYESLFRAVTEAAASMPRTRALVFRASPSADFIIRYLACHEAGVAAVPLERDASAEEMDRITDLAAKADIPEGVADILFTTGTTGNRKGTMISHSAIMADAENLIGAQGFSPSLTFIITGPLNHIGSLSKIWPCLTVGATVHLLDGLKDLSAFFGAVDMAEGKVATFQVPASLRMMMQMARRHIAERSDRFDFIETGAAPMAQADMEAWCAALPHTRLYNTYASTETGIIATHDFNAGVCEAGCLGKPMRHSSISIGADGFISCSGATLMTGYLGDDEATRKVLHDGAVHTADRGSIDSEGRLRLAGRDGDVINTGGYKINPVEVEDVAMAHPAVEDCICIPAPHPVLGTSLRLLVVTNGHAPLDKKQFAAFLASRLERHKVPLLYSVVESIRRTFNGKLDRKSYANATEQ